jgi:hypothetical protein
MDYSLERIKERADRMVISGKACLMVQKGKEASSEILRHSEEAFRLPHHEVQCIYRTNDQVA